MARRYDSDIATQLNNTDTPVPGKGLQEVVIIITLLPIAGILWATAQALDAATNQAAWEAFKATMRANLQLTGAILIIWALVAIHAEQWLIGLFGWLFIALLDRSKPVSELVSQPNQAASEPGRIRGLLLDDIDYFVSRVLLWRTAEEAVNKTSWRQEIWRDEPMPSSGEPFGDDNHQILTQMLQDIGALKNYGPKRKGKLTITSRAEIMSRIEKLA